MIVSASFFFTPKLAYTVTTLNVCSLPSALYVVTPPKLCLHHFRVALWVLGELRSGNQDTHTQLLCVTGILIVALYRFVEWVK